MKAYRHIQKKAPLPFVGQKRFALRGLYDYFAEHGLPAHVTRIVDAYGGSGLLANLFKEMFPDREVIWNDYDNYAERLNHVEDYEALRHALQEAMRRPDGSLKEKEARYTEEEKRTVMDILKDYPDLHAPTVSGWINFQYGKAKIEPRYHNVPTSIIPTGGGYLKGVTRVCCDALELIVPREDTLYIVDPPYLSRNDVSYKGGITKAGTLRLLRVLRQCPHVLLFCYEHGLERILFEAGEGMSTDEILEQWESGTLRRNGCTMMPFHSNTRRGPKGHSFKKKREQEVALFKGV